LGRFQVLCEKYGMRPTYLTDYEMARCPLYAEFARDAEGRGAAEIGMHLHAWNSPPISPLTADDYAFTPYLMEYPDAVMREKIRYMTATIEEVFGVTPVSHRAGRWGFNATYARMLVENGYLVDCSVVPLTSYRRMMGNPDGQGGPDFTNFPDRPYFLDLTDISRAGNSTLLELPFTVMDLRPDWAVTISKGPVRKVVNRMYARAARLRPDGTNLSRMLQIVRRAVSEGRPYVEFMLHSSEFMPGGSPTFRDERQIETLYEHLEELFALSAKHFMGGTLAGFYRSYTETGASASA
jgi:hypothetical protein